MSISTSHCTDCQFRVTLSTGGIFSLSTVTQYLTLNCLSVSCPSHHCHLVQYVHCLSVPHTVLSVGSLSLFPLPFCSVCPLSLSTSHCSVCHFPVPLTTCALFSLSTVFQYLTLYCLSDPCHSLHWCFFILSTVSQYLTLYCLSVPCPSLHLCLVQSVHSLSLPHTVVFVISLSLSPLVSCSVCPLSLSLSH